MAAEPDLLESVSSSYAAARKYWTRASALIAQATFRIDRGTTEETLASLNERLKLNEEQRLTLSALAANKPGAAFIDERVQDINRAAYHRSAFLLNALVQFLFVDVASTFFVTLPQIKYTLIIANLMLAGLAQATLREAFNAMLAGPNALPPKRIFFGLFPNREYNRAVKKNSRPYARHAWRENSLYRPAYFVNAGSIFLGAQFIIPLEKLIFPFGFLIGKIMGLFTTAVMIFDIWRGIRAGDDARLAREKEVSVYKDLNI